MASRKPEDHLASIEVSGLARADGGWHWLGASGERDAKSFVEIYVKRRRT